MTKAGPTNSQHTKYSGSNYALDTPKAAEVVPIDKWNTTRIEMKNPHVEHWLNGKKVVEYDLWSGEWKAHKTEGKWKKAPHYGEAKKGHIGLQNHGGLTMFRNIKSGHYKAIIIIPVKTGICFH